MAKKIQVKQILELRAAGLSQNSIAKSRHMGLKHHQQRTSLPPTTQPTDSLNFGVCFRTKALSEP